MIENINGNVNKIIVSISFLICVYIVLEELYNLSKFAYNYNYNYNIGKTLNKISGNDYIEYETIRYQISNNIDKIKLSNDVYNKSKYVSLIYYLSIFYFIIIILSFGVLFYETFIKNQQCPSLKDDKSTHNSILYILLNCLCGDVCTKTINNCFISYLLLIFIVILIPIYLLLKGFFNIDISNYSSYYYIYIIIFAIILIFRISNLSLNIFRKILSDYDNNKSFFIYIIYFIVLIVILYIFSDLSKIITKNSSIQSNSQNFYLLYKKEAPIRPKFIIKPNIVNTFTPSTIYEINNMSKSEQTTYYNNKSIVDKYYNDIKQYNIDMKNYKIELELYNIGNIKYPPKIDIFNDIIKNMFGINNYNYAGNDISKYILILFIICIIIYAFYYLMNNNQNNQNELKLIYNCIFIPFFNLFLIILLINSITTFNTYVNKYIIYNPISAYKNDMHNINWYFCKLYEIYNNTNSNVVPEKIGNSLINNIYSSLFKFSLLTNTQITWNTTPKPTINYYNLTQKNYTVPSQNQCKLLNINNTGIIKNNNDLISFIKNIFYISDVDINKISINLTNNIINNINNYNTINIELLKSSLVDPDAISVSKTLSDPIINKKYSSYINLIVKIYIKNIKLFKNIFTDALLKAGGNCSDITNINNMTSDIDLYTKIVNPGTDSSNFYFLNNEIMNKINKLFYEFNNELYLNFNNYNDKNINNPFVSNIISNYNDYNNNTYNFNNFITENINISDNNYLDNEDNMKSNITTTSTSSSILFIIILIILLEPLYIE